MCPALIYLTLVGDGMLCVEYLGLLLARAFGLSTRESADAQGYSVKV